MSTSIQVNIFGRKLCTFNICPLSLAKAWYLLHNNHHCSIGDKEAGSTKNAEMVVPVSIDARIFRDFALFDSFVQKRRWRPLALFSGILLCSACACFAMRGRAEQAVLLGGILVLVGLGLPIVYVLSFLSSIRQQSKKMRLATGRHAYTLTLTAQEGVTVSTGKEQLSYRWNELFAVYRVRQYTYVYVSPQKAFLLPDAQLEGGAGALWQLLKGAVPAGRLYGRRLP